MEIYQLASQSFGPPPEQDVGGDGDEQEAGQHQQVHPALQRGPRGRVQLLERGLHQGPAHLHTCHTCHTCSTETRDPRP